MSVHCDLKLPLPPVENSMAEWSDQILRFGGKRDDAHPGKRSLPILILGGELRIWTEDEITPKSMVLKHVPASKQDGVNPRSEEKSSEIWKQMFFPLDD